MVKYCCALICALLFIFSNPAFAQENTPDNGSDEPTVVGEEAAAEG